MSLTIRLYPCLICFIKSELTGFLLPIFRNQTLLRTQIISNIIIDLATGIPSMEGRLAALVLD